ncbi:hypothetical protein NC651_030375 [Populus alba x Populus x berolinensis]|nr:hypothetical protein NC651_030375 [Populus alba x Populus x berolinensis]
MKATTWDNMDDNATYSGTKKKSIVLKLMFKTNDGDKFKFSSFKEKTVKHVTFKDDTKRKGEQKCDFNHIVYILNGN